MEPEPSHGSEEDAHLYRGKIRRYVVGLVLGLPFAVAVYLR